MHDRAEVQCPYCFEWVEIAVDPQTRGLLVEDCQVCCNPWQVRVERDGEGKLSVEVERLQ
jgi:hypothetical protein